MPCCARNHHHEQVRARAEVIGFVADHQSIEIFFHAVERFGGDVAKMSSSSAFILVWNSTSATPSPMSYSDAPAFSVITFFVPLEILQHDHAFGPLDLHILLFGHIIHADLVRHSLY